MKKCSAALLFGLFAVGLFLLGNLLFFRPFSIDAFYTRSFAKFALEKPQMLSSLHILEQYGIKFHQSRLDDESEAHHDKSLADFKHVLKDLKEYDTSKFTPDQKNNFDAFERFITDSIESSDRWRYHNYPLNQLSGIQSDFPSFMDSVHQVHTHGDAQDYVARLSQVHTQFTQVLEGLELREQKGIIPPRFVITKVLDEMKDFIRVAP